MKVLADIVAGLWSALCIGATLLWESGVKFWNGRSDTQKSVLLAVLIVVVSLSVASVVRAENAPNSNFGVVKSLSEPGTAYACYLSDGDAALELGNVHTCLILQAVGPGILATFGQVTFCTQTGMHNDKPKWSCGKYEDMYKLAMGV